MPILKTLQEAHDIGESLQNKIERLEEVERAFVHLDFESTHHPSQEHKQFGVPMHNPAATNTIQFE